MKIMSCVREDDALTTSCLERTRRSAPSYLLIVILTMMGAACSNFGPAQVERDQLGYSKSLAQSQKNQLLLNVVRIRYGDAPLFLNLTQVIDGYQLQQSANVGFETFPGALVSSFVSGAGSVQVQQNPTFTFQPVAGRDYAQSFLRPLSPIDLLPFTNGALPIDLLLRLTANSINDYKNPSGFSDAGPISNEAFLRIVKDLRKLQVAGVLVVSIERSDGPSAPSGSATSAGMPAHAVLKLTGTNANSRGSLIDLTHLLKLSPTPRSIEVIYGRDIEAPGQIAINTRSIIEILNAVAFDIEVPAADVATGATLPSSSANDPPVHIHSGVIQPKNAFAQVEYAGSWYWISDEDFQSKLAFAVIQLLSNLVNSKDGAGAIVTVPAR